MALKKKERQISRRPILAEPIDTNLTGLVFPSHQRSKPLGPGRRTRINDLSLGHRRDCLTNIFELEWSDIGWEIAHVRSRKDVLRLLSPIAQRGYYGQHLMELAFPQEQMADAKLIRRAQKDVGNLVAQQRVVRERLNEKHIPFGELERAWAQASDEDKERLKPHWERSRTQQRSLQEEYDRLAALLESAEVQQMMQKAFFCRTEVVKFIRSKRYPVNPLNLGNALAGLPEMGWRRSFVRCSQLERGIAPHLEYELFLLIETVLKKREPGISLEELFRKQLSKTSANRHIEVEELKNRWPDLKRGFQECEGRSIHPRQLHFKLAAAMKQSRYRNKSSVEQALEQTEVFEPL